METIKFSFQTVLMTMLAFLCVAMCMMCTSCSSGDDDLPEPTPAPVENVAKHRIRVSIYSTMDDLWKVDGCVWGTASMSAKSNPELKLDFPDVGGYAKYISEYDRDSYDRNQPAVLFYGATDFRVTSVQDCEYLTVNFGALSTNLSGDYSNEILWVKLEGYVDGVLTNKLEKEITGDHNIYVVFSSVPRDGDYCNVTDIYDICK